MTARKHRQPPAPAERSNYRDHGRRRFTVRWRSYDNGYTETSELHVTPDPSGPALSSLLPDGRHAPVLDVDAPVRARYSPDGTTQVTFSGRFRARRVATELGGLVSAGLVDELTGRVVADLAAQPWWRRVRSVTVTFPYPVEALASKTPGHHHLLAQTELTWEQTRTLAVGLAAAGLCDPAHVAATWRDTAGAPMGGRHLEFIYVDQPL